MKDLKKILIVVVAAVIGFVAGVVGTRVYDGVESQIESNQEEIEDPADMLCYYGCPNSRRVKKLNLFKSKRIL